METRAGCHSNSGFQGESTIHFHSEDSKGTLNSVLPLWILLYNCRSPHQSCLHTWHALTEVSIWSETFQLLPATPAFPLLLDFLLLRSVFSIVVSLFAPLLAVFSVRSFVKLGGQRYSMLMSGSQSHMIKNKFGDEVEGAERKYWMWCIEKGPTSSCFLPSSFNGLELLVMHRLDPANYFCFSCVIYSSCFLRTICDK